MSRTDEIGTTTTTRYYPEFTSYGAPFEGRWWQTGKGIDGFDTAAEAKAFSPDDTYSYRDWRVVEETITVTRRVVD